MRTVFLSVFITVIVTVLVALLLQSGVITFPEKTSATASKESVYDRVLRTETIRCGYSVWKPLMWVDPNSNKKMGIFPDLMEEIGRRLGLKIVWQEELGWGMVVESVKTGRVDMACAGYWLQANRFKHVAASTPLIYAPIYVWGRANDARAFNKIEDLNNAQYILAKIDGGAVNQIAKDRFPKAKGLSLSEMSTNIDVIESVITGKADFAVDDATSFMGYMKNNPNKIKRFFDEAVGVFPAVMLLPPNDTHFKQMIDDAMKSIEYDGKLDVILKANKMEKEFFRNPKPVRGN